MWSTSTSKAPLDLVSLARYLKPTVTNLGVKIDYSLKIDQQINCCKIQLFPVKDHIKGYALPFFQLFWEGYQRFCLFKTWLLKCPPCWCLSDFPFTTPISSECGCSTFNWSTQARAHFPDITVPTWLPVSFRINFKILLFTFKALNGLAPSYLSSLLHPCVSSRALRFADRSLLAVSKTQLKQRGDRAVAVVVPKLWNELPLQIRLEPTMPVFKSHLKTHLFSQAFSVSVWMRVALWTEFCVLNSC